MILPIVLSSLFFLPAIVNLPLGYLGQGYNRLTFGWFFYNFLSVPVIIYLWTKTDCGAGFFPLPLAGAVAGLFLGGNIARKRKWIAKRI
jgi:hypothetical protein